MPRCIYVYTHMYTHICIYVCISSMVCAEMLAHGAFRCSRGDAKHVSIPQAEVGKKMSTCAVPSLPHCPPLPQPPTSQPNLPHNTDETRPLQHVVPASPGLTS